MYEADALGSDLESHAPAERGDVWHAHLSTGLGDTLAATGTRTRDNVSYTARTVPDTSAVIRDVRRRTLTSNDEYFLELDCTRESPYVFE